MTDAKQPETLRLADAIDPPQIACLPETRAFAAAELRRLHEVNQELVKALKLAQTIIGFGKEWDQIDAAIAKAEGELK